MMAVSLKVEMACNLYDVMNGQSFGVAMRDVWRDDSARNYNRWG